MYNVNRQCIHKTKSKIFVSKKLPSITDEYGNEITQYDEPQKFMFNVQPLTEDSEIREFGELVNSMRRITITNKPKYLNVFTEFDKVYVDNRPNSNEIEYGENADYRIYLVRNQNTMIVVYLIKEVK